MTAPADSYSYAYLLGLYLGDGHLASNGRSWQLVVSLDAAHEEIIEECRGAMVLTMPSRTPRLGTHPTDRYGCRTVNRFKTKLPSGRIAEYAYPRYFFSNLSPDIRTLFCEACDRLALRWTQSNHRNISVSHRASVALLDEYVGPKR